MASRWHFASAPTSCSYLKVQRLGPFYAANWPVFGFYWPRFVAIRCLWFRAWRVLIALFGRWNATGTGGRWCGASIQPDCLIHLAWLPRSSPERQIVNLRHIYHLQMTESCGAYFEYSVFFWMSTGCFLLLQILDQSLCHSSSDKSLSFSHPAGFGVSSSGRISVRSRAQPGTALAPGSACEA